MKITIESNDMLLALRMVSQIIEAEDGTYNFTGGFMVEVKTTKTQRMFKVVKLND